LTHFASEQMLQQQSKNIRNYHGAYILRLVRDGVCRNWSELCRHFFGNESTSDYLFLAPLVSRLFDQGLLEYTVKPHAEFSSMSAIMWGANAEPSDINDQLQVSERWHNLQSALGISSTKVASLDPPGAEIVRPFFGALDNIHRALDVFVMMPFTAEIRPVYEDHIVRTVNRLNKTVARGDDFFGTGSIMSKIWAAICSARIIIADCTGRNPNVFYEIGVAHTVGKPVILITQEIDDVPFDLRHIRFIRYEFTPRGMRTFEESLEATLRNELSVDSDAAR
jgi:hypothetical protein